MEKELYKKYSEIEEKMWWYKARRNIIEEIIKTIINEGRNKILLDFGAGTGSLSKMMNKYIKVKAIDNNQEVLKYSVFPITITNLQSFSAENSYDVITAFDVLEHCHNDEEIIEKFAKILKPDGIIFITVPAYQFLWSSYDDAACHFRRYTIKKIQKKFKKNGFVILKTSYFNSLLFPFLAADILLNKITYFFYKKQKDNLKIPNKMINNLFFNIFNLEKKWLKNHNFFYGGSILLIAKKYN